MSIHHRHLGGPHLKSSEQQQNKKTTLNRHLQSLQMDDNTNHERSLDIESSRQAIAATTQLVAQSPPKNNTNRLDSFDYQYRNRLGSGDINNTFQHQQDKDDRKSKNICVGMVGDITRRIQYSISKHRGVLSVLGGTMTHTTLGTMYCWGNYISYLPPSMQNFSWSISSEQQQQQQQRDVGAPDALWVLPITMFFMCLAMPFSSTVLQSTIGLRPAMIFGGLIMSSGVFLSSFAHTLEEFSFFYCILFGTGVGVAYTAPIAAAWSWFPTRKGLVSGCILAGFGSGGFVFNAVGTAIANPGNIAPSEVDEEGDDRYGVTAAQFSDEVYMRFPFMLQCLAFIYVVMQIIGFILVKEPSKEYDTALVASAGNNDIQNWDNHDDGEGLNTKEYTAREAVCTWEFAVIWFCIMLSASAGLNVVSVYKLYGSRSYVLNDDSYLALVGGFGSVANGVGRAFWGMSQDRYGTRWPFMTLTFTQSIIMVFYNNMLQSRIAFGFSTFLVFLCLGGNFALAPGACAKLFGTSAGPKVFSILFSAFATAAIVGSVLNRKLLASHGFEMVFNLMAGLSILSCFCINMLKSL